MSKKSIIGHVDCHICGHTDAEVKTDKNGHAYIFCPDCRAQGFTRSDDRDASLRKRMRAITVTVTEEIAPPVPAVTAPVPNTTASAKTGTAAGPVPQKTEPAVIDQPKPKKASWFSPVLAGGK